MSSFEPHFQHRQSAHCESGVMASLLSHAGLPMSEPMAFGLASGLAEMFLPAMLLKDADVLVKFVTAIVSVSSVLFLSASIPCVLATRIPLSLGHLLLIWLQRTLLSLVLSIPLAYLVQSLGWL